MTSPSARRFVTTCASYRAGQRFRTKQRRSAWTLAVRRSGRFHKVPARETRRDCLAPSPRPNSRTPGNFQPQQSTASGSSIRDYLSSSVYLWLSFVLIFMATDRYQLTAPCGNASGSFRCAPARPCAQRRPRRGSPRKSRVARLAVECILGLLFSRGIVMLWRCQLQHRRSFV